MFPKALLLSYNLTLLSLDLFLNWGQSKELTVSIIFYSFQELYSKFYVQGTFWPRVLKLLANTQSFS